MPICKYDSKSNNYACTRLVATLFLFVDCMDDFGIHDTKDLVDSFSYPKPQRASVFSTILLQIMSTSKRRVLSQRRFLLKQARKF